MRHLLMCLLYGVFVISVSGTPAYGDSSKAELLSEFLAGPMQDVEEIVFACRQPGPDGHWYANFGYFAEDRNRKTYRAMGRLCKLNLKTNKVTILLDDEKGTVRDPQVHYNGQKMIFSYRKGDSEHFHLYEMDIDGKNMKQLTDGAWDDIEPSYVADGGIIFCSSRCNRWVNCWLTQVAVLYRCDADGKNIRQLSSNAEHENTPWPLPDGRILYQRWEYVDRSQVHYHHLWSMNPDGTGQMVYFGNMHPGIVMIDAKPIPDSQNVLALFSPGHGQREHAGAVTIVSPKKGPDDIPSARRISRSNNYRDPYPFSHDCFLVAQDDRILVMNGRGQTQEIYRLPSKLAQQGVQCHEPRPIHRRERERLIQPQVELAAQTGRFILADVYQGRNMEGIKQYEIKNLLLLESLPKPINYTGGMDPLSYGGTFTLERVLGMVPVEEDGSAYFEVPANRSLIFVALDQDHNSLKRMQSFCTVMPGETTSCVGCHEHRTQAPLNKGNLAIQALKRSPSKIQPIEGVPEVFDFPRDIQPILDKHCIQCHDYDNYEGKVILTGDRGPMFSHSYYTLTILKQFVDGRNDPKSNLPPRYIGATNSPLLKKIMGGHRNVKLSPTEINRIRFWIETGAAYPGTYGALGSGMIGGYHENRQVFTDFKWKESQAAEKAFQARCASCHKENLILPKNLSDERGISFWRPNFNDSRLRLARHAVYNLSRPEKSLMLLAPLAKKAGGYGICKVNDSKLENSPPKSVFETKDDPGYQAILAMCREGKRQLEKIKRFDMPDFQPPQPYLREMQRYGVLPEELVADKPIDVYAVDRAYWRSLWYKPVN
jgi:hydrazine synthase alpha subunit-like protein